MRARRYEDKWWLRQTSEGVCTHTCRIYVEGYIFTALYMMRKYERVYTIVGLRASEKEPYRNVAKPRKRKESVEQDERKRDKNLQSSLREARRRRFFIRFMFYCLLLTLWLLWQIPVLFFMLYFNFLQTLVDKNETVQRMRDKVHSCI